MDMRIKKVTLKDIAEETGISINSVSLALRGIRVSAETQRLVRETAERMGYIGNAVASSIRTGTTKNIAIIVGDIANPYTARILKSCVSSFRNKGYSTMIFNTDENEEYEKNAIISALRHNVDAVLVSPVHRNGQNMQILAEADLPSLIIGSASSIPGISSICMDDEKAGYLAASYLIRRGHRRIVFVDGPENVQGAEERLYGCLRAFIENGIEFPKENILYCDLERSRENLEEIRRKLTDELDYTAVIAYSDMMAMQIWAVIRENNAVTRIKRENIVGFDNALELLPAEMRFVSAAEKGVGIDKEAPELALQILEDPEHGAVRRVLDVCLHNVR